MQHSQRSSASNSRDDASQRVRSHDDASQLVLDQSGHDDASQLVVNQSVRADGSVSDVVTFRLGNFNAGIFQNMLAGKNAGESLPS